MARSPSDADAFTAVAEPRRREILEILVDREQSVNEVAEALDLPQPVVSKHLKVLREVELVDVRDVGRRRLYRIKGLALLPIVDWLQQFERLWEQRFAAMDDVLDELTEEKNG